MSRPFGEIPTPNPNAASAIADAARHVEQLLQDEQALDSPPDTSPFPRTGIDIPGVEDADVDVVEVEPSTFPVEPGKDDHSHDGAAGGVVDGGAERGGVVRKRSQVADDRGDVDDPSGAAIDENDQGTGGHEGDQGEAVDEDADGALVALFRGRSHRLDPVLEAVSAGVEPGRGAAAGRRGQRAGEAGRA